MNTVLLFCGLFALAPKRLFARLNLNMKKLELLLVSPLLIALLFLSVQQQNYNLLLISFILMAYVISFIVVPNIKLLKKPLKIKMYNLGTFKNIRYVTFKLTRLFYIVKIMVVFSLLSYFFFNSLILQIIPVIILFTMLFISKNFTSVSLAPLQSYVDNQVISTLKEYQPKIIFYFSASNENFTYHISMWTPYLQKLNINFYIMVRESKYRKKLLEITKDIPVIEAISMQDVENFLLPSVQIALYANNGTKNTHLVRFNHLTHIQMLHGDSEKAPSFNPVSKMYDKLFVCGQRAIDRYEENDVHINKDVFSIVGRPQVSQIKKYYEQEYVDDIKTILIAPTWLGIHKDSQYSSLMQVGVLIDTILSMNLKYKIILRLHPLTDINSIQLASYMKNIEEKLELDSINHIFNSKNDIIDDFNNSNCIVTDVSSVPVDYLYSIKPIIHIDVHSLSEELRSNIIYKRYSEAIYLIDENLENSKSILETVFIDDYLLKKREDVMRYYHGADEDTFYNELKKYIR